MLRVLLVAGHGGSGIGLLFAVLLCGELISAAPAVAVERYQSDDWITVCEPAPGGHTPECSITVSFGGIQHGERGAFALAVILDTGNVGIVGRPFPVGAVLRVDRDPPVECREWRYCLFPHEESLAAIKALGAGSLILIDVFTARASFRFSLTPRGYQAGLAEIRAWGYRFPGDRGRGD